MKGWVFLFILTGQFALLALTFPLPQWEVGQALFHIDHPYHLYQIALGRELIANGQFVGYDPFFGAGYLGGATLNASAKLPVLISLLIPDSVSTVSLYLHYVFICALIAPVSIVVVAFLLRWPIGQTIVATVIGFLFWWLGAFRWYHTAGMVSFVCACYTSIPYAVWVFRAILLPAKDFRFLKVVSAGLLGGLGLWLHPLFGVVASIILMAFLVGHFSKIRWSTVISTGALIGLIAVVTNLPWLLAISGGSELLDQPYQKAVGLSFLVNAIIGIWDQSLGTMINPLVIVFALLALIVTTGEKHREATIFLCGGAVCIVFASFGASVALLAGMQPNRFLAPGFLLIGLAASYSTGRTTLWLTDKTKRQSLRLGGLVIVLSLATVLGRELVREILPGTHGRYGKAPPEVTYPPETVAWLETWVKENTTSDGRILFETSLSRKHAGGHIAGYLALQTKREFIGAPYPFLMPERSFWDQTGFGRPLSELSDEQLVAGIDLYNIGWFITHTDQLSKRIASLPSARLIAEISGIRLFSINRPLSFAHTGHARIDQRDFDRLMISTTDGTDLILRYHWIKKLKITPSATLEPVSLFPGHPPFIRVRNPPAHFLIHVNQ